MPFLLETNVVSETIRPRPERKVIEWIEAQVPTDLFLAAHTLGELVRGASRVGSQARRERYEKWIGQDLARQFEGRILPFDQQTALVWGRLMGDGDRVGRPPSAADAYIAAVALQHDLVLVTRNVKDFAYFNNRILDPWQNWADRE